MMDHEITTNIKDTPVLLIDFKKNRLRIHKNTLTLMGNPDYIQFLVNPSEQSLVITPSHEKDNLSHKIRWSLLSDGYCCEFYSKHLVRTLQLSFFPYAKEHSCRFYGEMIRAKETIALFSLKNPIPIDDSNDFERNKSHVCS